MMPDRTAIEKAAYHRWLSRGSPSGSAEEDWLAAEDSLGGQSDSQASLDEALDESFPASDPPASQIPDEPPVNAKAKRKSAGRTKKDA